ncbi:hypothetical protein V8C86DRAFT_2853426 [Haematococcus lacustris]
MMRVLSQVLQVLCQLTAWSPHRRVEGRKSSPLWGSTCAAGWAASASTESNKSDVDRSSVRCRSSYVWRMVHLTLGS